MLDHKIIEPSQSEWGSPVILVPTPDGSQRLCIDYRKVNSVTKTHSYPIPRIDDCIDKIGKAKYVTKFDLVKGFSQISLSERAKEIPASVTPDGLYSCIVMPFGMKNAPSSFQRLKNYIVHGRLWRRPRVIVRVRVVVVLVSSVRRAFTGCLGGFFWLVARP